MNTGLELPIWKPRHDNRIDLPELCFMHGGPSGMHLPEHEHSEVQLELHFIAHRDRKRSKIDPMPAFMKLIPSGKAHVGRWQEGDEVVVILLGQEYIAQAADAVGRHPSSSIVDTDCAVDPVLHTLGTTLRLEFLNGGVADRAYLEALGIVLSGHIARQWSSCPSYRKESGRLTPTQLRRTIEMIEQGRTQSIKSLSSILGLGPHQFSRLFRQSTGQSPYQYIVQRRLKKACALLASTNLPLAQIALEVGFASQSHFTAVFHRHFRLTPLRFRHERQQSSAYGVRVHFSS